MYLYQIERDRSEISTWQQHKSYKAFIWVFEISEIILQTSHRLIVLLIL
jgi:hypothetical protein